MKKNRRLGVAAGRKTFYGFVWMIGCRLSGPLRAACFAWWLAVSLPPEHACAADVVAHMEALRQKPARELQAIIQKQFEENRCMDVIDTAVVLSDKIPNKRTFEWAATKSYEGRCYLRLTDGPIKPQVQQDLIAKSLDMVQAANAVFSRLPRKTPVVSHVLINLTAIADANRFLAETADAETHYPRAEDALAAASDIVEKHRDISKSALAGFIAIKTGDLYFSAAQRAEDRPGKSRRFKKALREYRKAILYDYGEQKPQYETWILGRTGAVLESLGSLHQDEGYHRQAVASYRAMLDVPGRSQGFFADLKTNLRIIVLHGKATLASIRS